MYTNGTITFGDAERKFYCCEFITVPSAKIVRFNAQLALFFQALIAFEHSVDPVSDILIFYPSWDFPDGWRNPDIFHERLVILKVVEFRGKGRRERYGPPWVMQGSQFLTVSIELADCAHEHRLSFSNCLSCLLVEFRPCPKLVGWFEGG